MSDYSLGDAILTLITDSTGLESGLASAKQSGQEYDTESSKYADHAQKSWEESFNLTRIAAMALSVEGFKKLIEAAAEMVMAFAEDEKAQLSLDAALETSGTLIPHNVDKINELVESFSRLSGEERETAQSMITMLAATGRTDEEIAKMLKAANGYAIATGVDLRTALTQLDQTFSGTIGRMGRMTPELADLTKEQLRNGEAIDVMLRKYGNMSTVLEHSTDVTLKNYKNEWHEVAAAFGGEITKQFSWIGELMHGLANQILDQNSALNAFSRGFMNLVEVGKQLVLSLVGQGNIFTAIKNIADTAKNAVVGQTEAVQALMDKEIAYWRIADAVRASAAGAAARAAALQVEADRIRKEAADAVQAQIKLELKMREEAAQRQQEIIKAESDAYAKHFADLRKEYGNDITIAQMAGLDKLKNEREYLARLQEYAKAHGGTINSIEADKQYLVALQGMAAQVVQTYQQRESAIVKAAMASRNQMLGIARQLSGTWVELFKDYSKEGINAADEVALKWASAAKMMLGAIKPVFNEIGAELVKGGLSWNSLATVAVHAIGGIVNALGDQLAGMAAAKLAEAIANSLDPLMAWAAPGEFAAAGELGIGAAAAWVAAGMLNAVSFSKGADFTVPPGFNNDSFPMLVESGEHVQVTPANKSGGDGQPLSVTLMLDGSVLGKWLQKASKNQEIIIHAAAVVQ